MKPYVVILSVKPAVRLPRQVELLELKFVESSGTKKALISKIEEKDEFGTIIQTGLKYKIFLNAKNTEDAIYLAKGLSDGITSFITMITGRGMDIPNEEIVYELTPNIQEREYRQIFYDIPMKSMSRRELDPNILINFINKYNELDPSFAERIARAIRWYRLGTLNDDVFDQFNCFWIGLEALNPLLQQKLSIGDDPTRCPKCKNEWVSHLTVSGIRKFIQEELKAERRLYRNIHNIRNDIAHSRKRLHEIKNLVSTYAPKAREALFRSICYIFGFENWKTLTHDEILREFPTRGELWCSLVGGDPLSLGPNGEDPHFELHHQITGSIINENGTLSYDGQSSFTAHLNPNVIFLVHELRFYGDSGMSGEITSRTLRRASGEEVPV